LDVGGKSWTKSGRLSQYECHCPSRKTNARGPPGKNAWEWTLDSVGGGGMRRGNYFKCTRAKNKT